MDDGGGSHASLKKIVAANRCGKLLSSFPRRNGENQNLYRLRGTQTWII